MSAPPAVLPTALRSARRVAFFDVDETLLAGKSLFSFWRFWTAHERPAAAQPSAPVGPQGADVPRSVLNRAYYQRYAGVPRSRLEEAGRRWYADHRTGPGAFVTASLAALDRHRAAGHGVVLVSGSAEACVRPLAADLGADLLLCTEQLAGEAGVLTGEVRRPMIGAAKAEAVSEVLDALGLTAEDSYGYGDHASDLAMLQRVGSPTVVGDDAVLTQHARQLGWCVLPATRGPRGGRRVPAG